MVITPLHQAPQYAAILAQWAYDEWYRSRSFDFDLVLSAFLARTKNESLPQSFVAVENSLPVGMVTLKLDDLWARKDINPWLSSLYVHPGYREHGIGQALVRSVIIRAFDIGFPGLYLFLSQSQKERLKRYYIKRGWEVIGDAPDNDGLETQILKFDLVQTRSITASGIFFP
jgi:GNAT superfamily N-acetyltransferase